MYLIDYIIAVVLIVSGSTGINYYNRLADCNATSVSSDEFGRIYSIVSICLGVCYLIFKIIEAVVKSQIP